METRGRHGLSTPDLAALVAGCAEAYRATGDRSAMALAKQLGDSSPGFALPAAQAQPALASLSGALANLPPGPLAPLLKACAPAVPWTVGDFKMPASFAGRSAYVEIVGPEGLAQREGLRFGLYVQTPESLYPPHNHAAEELYYVLSGTARWQKADGEFRAMAPGTLIRHAPWERHAMRTDSEPLLAMWSWTGDLSVSAYRVDGA
ncbi:MAG TPA: dimethylsulfonioproprionate lyase family protein [Candidatus Udaeobacter sp.]|nr:dimethylsulfonioproprionate lyase family protein [Candidatus Udaeobacter sp.]